MLSTVFDFKAQFVWGNAVPLVCCAFDVSRGAGSADLFVRGRTMLFFDHGFSLFAEDPHIDEENGGGHDR